MQYIYVAVAAIALLKDSFKGLFDSKEFKTLIVVVVVYYIYQAQKLKEKAAEYDKPNNPIGKLARKLHKALHPYLPQKLPLLGYLDDGTDETAVKEVGNEIGKLNKLDNLTEAYQAIFGDNLNDALSADDVSDDFDTAYQLGLGGKTIPKSTGVIDTVINTTKKQVVTPPPSAGASVRNSIGLVIEVGKYYKVKGGINLRDTTPPYNIEDSTEQGETYRIIQLLKNVPINNKKYVVAVVQYMQDIGITYFPSPFSYTVIVDAFNSKVNV